MRSTRSHSLAAVVLAAVLPLSGWASQDYLRSTLRRGCGVPPAANLVLAALPDNPFLMETRPTSPLAIPLPAPALGSGTPFHRSADPEAPRASAERARNQAAPTLPLREGMTPDEEVLEAPAAELFPDEATLSLLDDSELDVTHEEDEVPDLALFPDAEPPVPMPAAPPLRLSVRPPAPRPRPASHPLPSRPMTAHPPASRERVPQAVPVLTFHDLSVEPIAQSIVTPVKRFEEMLLYLKAHKYQSYFASRIPELLAGDCKDLRPGHRPVVLTFDDGYRNNYELLYPLLKKHDVKITLHLIVAKLVEERGEDTGNALTWNEVTEMAASGLVEMAGHTFNMHANLPKCLARSSDPERFKKRLWADLYTSRAVLEAELGSPITVFAWPLGKRSPELTQLAAQAGFSIIFNTHFGSNVPGHCELFDLCRINVSHVDFGARALHGRLQAARRKALHVVRMASTD